MKIVLKLQLGGLVKILKNFDNAVTSLRLNKLFKNTSIEKPLVETPFIKSSINQSVFHGSPKSNIQLFRIKPSTTKDGIFFTNSKSFALLYGNNLYEGYLNLLNPINIDGKSSLWSHLNIDDVAKLLDTTPRQMFLILKPIISLNIFLTLLNPFVKVPLGKRYYTIDLLVSYARKTGHDGVIARNLKDSGKGLFSPTKVTDLYVILDPKLFVFTGLKDIFPKPITKKEGL